MSDQPTPIYYAKPTEHMQSGPEVVLSELAQRESRVVSGGQLIDAQECAERLGVTYQTLLRAVKCGNIPAVMVQSSYRFHWPTVVATQNEL